MCIRDRSTCFRFLHDNASVIYPSVVEGFGNWIPSPVIVTTELLGAGAGAGDLVILMLFNKFLKAFILVGNMLILMFINLSL